MRRSQILLSVLGAVLVTAMFVVLLYQPQREALAEVEEAIAHQEDLQVALQADIARLRAVRESAPEAESDLAMMQAIVTRDSAALPAALRQLQEAADDAGLTLGTVTMGRPSPVADAPEGLASVAIGLQLEGNYFQVVDMLRRLEDPTITPRGFDWTNVTAAPGEEYPLLNVVLDGFSYADMGAPVAPPPEPAEDGASEGDDGDVDEPEDVELDAVDTEDVT